MAKRVQFNRDNCLAMQPLELSERLRNEMVFDIPEEVITDAGNRMASDTISKATAYMTFCIEMETTAKIMKRAAKTEKQKEEADRLMGLEEVFKSYKEIAKATIENVAKIMTLRRLDLDEQQHNGKIT